MSTHPDNVFMADLANLLTKRQKYLDNLNQQQGRRTATRWTTENVSFFLAELVYDLYVCADMEGRALALALSDLVITHRPNDYRWMENRVMMMLDSSPTESLNFALRALSAKETDHTHYLAALTHKRVGNDAEAVSHALKALEILRAEGTPPDPEYEDILEDLAWDGKNE